MLAIISHDIITAIMHYTPLAILSGLFLLAAIALMYAVIAHKEVLPMLRNDLKRFILIYVLYVYCFFVVSITFLSREPGSRNGLDLVLFSTFSNTVYSKVYIIENILLFIPLGVLLPALHRNFRKLLWCILSGSILSLMIETSQLLTKRGYFQTDDILTNTFGAVIGLGISYLISNLINRRKMIYHKLLLIYHKIFTKN